MTQLIKFDNSVYRIAAEGRFVGIASRTANPVIMLTVPAVVRLIAELEQTLNILQEEAQRNG